MQPRGGMDGPLCARTGGGSSGVSQVLGHFLSCRRSDVAFPFAVSSAELRHGLKSVGLYFFILKQGLVFHLPAIQTSLLFHGVGFFFFAGFLPRSDGVADRRGEPSSGLRRGGPVGRGGPDGTLHAGISPLFFCKEVPQTCPFPAKTQCRPNKNPPCSLWIFAIY